MGVKIPESLVVNIIKKDASKLIDKTGKWYTATEIDAGYGIADLVLYSLDQRKIRVRKRKGLPPLVSKEIIKTIIAFKEASKPISVSYLTHQLGVSERYIKYNILRFLLENGYVEKKNENYKLAFNYSPAISRTIAIEAKVSDWKRGLYQAHRYKWFCHESYLALYYKNITPALKNLHLFEKLNIGLLSVNNDTYEIVFRPTKEEPKAQEKVILANERIISSQPQMLSPILR